MSHSPALSLPRIGWLMTCALLSLALWTPLAHADYAMPALEQGLTSITHVVDATVVDFDEQHQAVLEIHEVMLGDPNTATTRIKSVSLTCMAGPVFQYGVKEGQRYLFFLQGDLMFEEQSFFSISPGKKGGWQIAFKPSYAQWLKLPKAQMDKEQWRQHLQVLAPSRVRGR